MTADEEIAIAITTDPADFEICAHMMSVSDPWITLGLDFNQCLKAFDGSEKEVYAIRMKTAIAGFVILQLGGSFRGYIQTICIGQSYRNKGLGKRLLQFCEMRILKISPNIFICVSSFNKGAIRLYDEFGFKPVGELTDFVRKGFTELLMRKTVGPIADYVAIE